MKAEITYELEKQLSSGDFIDILRRSGLAERRPIKEPLKIEAMLRHADLIVTARLENRIIGIARALSDFSFCTYLSDLAVDIEFQKSGIGKELIRQIKYYGGTARLILLSAPAAIGYYPKIGMKNFPYCFTSDTADGIK
jgi:ribosomal protein S18 acetylase RimI-like enzyme